MFPVTRCAEEPGLLGSCEKPNFPHCVNPVRVGPCNFPNDSCCQPRRGNYSVQLGTADRSCRKGLGAGGKEKRDQVSEGRCRKFAEHTRKAQLEVFSASFQNPGELFTLARRERHKIKSTSWGIVSETPSQVHKGVLVAVIARFDAISKGKL